MLGCRIKEYDGGDGSEVRLFSNGVSRHHQAVEAITQVILRLSAGLAEDEMNESANGREDYESAILLADRLYTILGDQEEAIKFVRTAAIVFPGEFASR